MHRTSVGLALGLLLASAASAQANVEVGGVAGAHMFSDSNALGVPKSKNADSEKNSALFGLRLGYYFNDLLGIEIEGGVIPSEPRSMVFDIYNATYRGQVVAQFRGAEASNAFVPFVLVGGGLTQVVSSKNTDIIKHDKDGMVYVGGGVKYRAANGWGVRGDLRAIIVPSSDPKGGETLDVEALLAIYKEFGRKEVKKVVVAPPPPPPKDEDPDKDGIIGAADKCPNDPEDKDGFQDDDGCPDPDNDGDGIPDATDKCPNEAEDKDGFQDDDGCPDPDNDGDGIPDAADKCPLEPETKNGFEDDDGCPDQIPDKVKKFSGKIEGINFKTGSSELAATSNKVLDQAVAVLVEFPTVRLEVGGHTDDVPLKAGKDAKYKTNEELSQARAESVKAYFEKKGIGADRITAKGYGDTQPVEDPKGLKEPKLGAARAKNRRVEFKLVSQDAAPATTPAPVPPAPAATPAAAAEPTPAAK